MVVVRRKSHGGPAPLSTFLIGPPSGHCHNSSQGPLFTSHKAKPNVPIWQENGKCGFWRAQVHSSPGHNSLAKQLAVSDLKQNKIQLQV